MNNIEFFDYKNIAKKMKVPDNILSKIEQDVKKEFPEDKMMYELHVMRAIKSRYWEKYYK